VSVRRPGGGEPLSGSFSVDPQIIPEPPSVVGGWIKIVVYGRRSLRSRMVSTGGLSPAGNSRPPPAGRTPAQGVGAGGGRYDGAASYGGAPRGPRFAPDSWRPDGPPSVPRRGLVCVRHGRDRPGVRECRLAEHLPARRRTTPRDVRGRVRPAGHHPCPLPVRPPVLQPRRGALRGRCRDVRAG